MSSTSPTSLPQHGGSSSRLDHRLSSPGSKLIAMLCSFVRSSGICTGQVLLPSSWERKPSRSSLTSRRTSRPEAHERTTAENFPRPFHIPASCLHARFHDRRQSAKKNSSQCARGYGFASVIAFPPYSRLAMPSCAPSTDRQRMKTTNPVPIGPLSCAPKTAVARQVSTKLGECATRSKGAKRQISSLFHAIAHEQDLFPPFCSFCEFLVVGDEKAQATSCEMIKGAVRLPASAL